jgi:hypothetical protein
VAECLLHAYSPIKLGVAITLTRLNLAKGDLIPA